MGKFRKCFSWGLAIIGSTVIWIGIAHAATVPDNEHITYKYAFEILLGVAVTLVGVYVKGVRDTLHNSINKNTSDLDTLHELHHQLNLRIAREYPTVVDLKDVIKQALIPLETEIRHLREMQGTRRNDHH